MIDLIKIYFPDPFPFPARAVLLSKGTGPGGDFMRATLDGLTLSQTPSGTTIRGSLARYYRGENVGEMTLRLTRAALAKLEAEFGFPLGAGQVRELEIGRTLIVPHPAAWYLDTWGEVPKFQRDTYGSGKTVLYRNKVRSFQGYDKGAQQGFVDAATRGGKGVEGFCQAPHARAEEFSEAPRAPALYLGRNLLRLEYKLKRRIDRIMKRPLTVADLTKPDTYVRLLKLWKAFYFKIPKRRTARLVFTGGQREFGKALEAVGVWSLGGPQALLTDLDRRTDLPAYERSRLRQRLREVTQAPEVTDPEALTKELDEAVRIAAASYR